MELLRPLNVFFFFFFFFSPPRTARKMQLCPSAIDATGPSKAESCRRQPTSKAPPFTHVKGGFDGGQVRWPTNKIVKKWILMTGATDADHRFDS